LNGVIAADFARRGFTGATRILEGERGFFRATSDSADPSRITDGLGTRWKVAENGYKLHACCGHTHTAVDTAIAFRDECGWSGGEASKHVRAIEIELYGPGYAIVQEPNPRTPYQAKFSIAYCVAAGLLEGQVGLRQFADERFGPDGVWDPGIAALLSRTTVRVDDELTSQYPERWPSRLAVRLTDGTALARESDYPRGHPENPVPLSVLEDKTRDLIAPRFDDALAGGVVEFVRGLETVSDMSTAMLEVLAVRMR
jgi:2-methylcitrate dehydratase PrpD